MAEPDQAAATAVTRAVGADGKFIVFGFQRTAETEVTAWARPRADAAFGTTQPTAGATEFVLSKSPDGWRLVRQKPAEQ